MKRLNRLCAILFLLVALGFNAACSYTVPNFEACVTMLSADGSPGGAFCKESLSDKEREITKEDWQKMIHTYMHLAPKDMGKILRFIEDVCNESKKCNKEKVRDLIYEYRVRTEYMGKKHAK